MIINIVLVAGGFYLGFAIAALIGTSRRDENE